MRYCIVCIRDSSKGLNLYDHYEFLAKSDTDARRSAARYADGRRTEEPDKKWVPVKLDRLEGFVETIPLFETSATAA